jgi:DNA invertase Pin-like site-specific DNA recombinase
VSTDAQAKKGDSLDEQMETCTNYVNSNDTMILQDVYIDDGISGQKLNRGDFSRLMDNVRAGSVDLIIFTKLDRWFRSLRHYLNTQATLEDCGVNWLAVSQPYYDTTTPQGRAFVAQSMTFAELEAQNDSERILSVFDYKYKHGEVLSGNVPLGYSIQNKHMIPNDDAEKALGVFEYYSRTGSLNATISFLETEYGIVMSQANLKKSILTNTKYIGVFRDNNEFCPAIIPRELFDDVQRKLQYNVKSSQRRAYIFAGLTVCACCNHSYGGFTQSCGRSKLTGERYKYPAYRCHGAYPNHRCANRKVMLESTLERYVLQNVKPLLSQYIVDYEIKAAPSVDNRQKRAAILSKIDKLKDLYVNDLITLDEFKADRAAYMEQIAALPDDNAPEKDLTALRDFMNMNINGIYETMTAEEKRYLWRSVIKEIRIDSNRNIEIIFL